VAEQFDSPVDMDVEAHAHAPGRPGLIQMSIAVGTAVFVLAMLNTHAIAAWADNLAPSKRTAGVVTVTHDLAGRTAAHGLDAPRAAMKAQWEKAKAARWRSRGEAQR
jgi:hypothetical protein